MCFQKITPIITSKPYVLLIMTHIHSFHKEVCPMAPLLESGVLRKTVEVILCGSEARS
jgi:hypothetical protein